MKALPPAVLLCAAVALGVFLGIRYLRRTRNKPVLVGIHLLLGGAGLEVVAMMLRGTPDGDGASGGALVKGAAGLLLAAMISGLLSPMVGRGSRRIMNVALATHASLAAAGFALFIAWALSA